MKQVICSAKIEDADKRAKVVEWVSHIANGGWAESGETVRMTYTEMPNDKDANSKYWSIVHWFEQYPEHEITQREI